MSFETKMQSARDLIEEYNSTAQNKVAWEEFEKKLLDLGASSELFLASVSWEDLQDCGLPRLLARILADVFRNGKKKQGQNTVITAAKALAMSPEDLIDVFHLDMEPHHPVAAQLARISKGHPFLVKDRAGNLLREESLSYLLELKKNFPPREIVNLPDDGGPVRLLKVGERSDDFVDENPLFPNMALRPDGSCDNTGLSWEDVDFQIRQLFRLAVVETDELEVSDRMRALDAVKMAQKSSWAELTQVFPKAAVVFTELSDLGGDRLPSLRMRLGTSEEGTKNDPFMGQGHVTT